MTEKTPSWVICGGREAVVGARPGPSPSARRLPLFLLAAAAGRPGVGFFMTGTLASCIGVSRVRRRGRH